MAANFRTALTIYRIRGEAIQAGSFRIPYNAIVAEF